MAAPSARNILPLLPLTADAGAPPTEYSAEKTAHVIDYTPTTNYGTNTVLSYGGDLAGILRAFLHFDLTLLIGQGINSASLALFETVGDFIGGNCKVYRVTQAGWTEAGVTWNKYDGTTDWTAAGGDFTTTDGNTFTIPSSSQAHTLDVKALVEDAIANRSGQLHIMLRAATESSVGPQGNAASDENATTANRPKLTIDYGTPTRRVPVIWTPNQRSVPIHHVPL